MAKYRRGLTTTPVLNRVAKHWADEFCSEHDGTVADFSKLNVTLADLADYRHIFKPKRKNMYLAARTAGCALLGGAVLVPVATLSAPGIASAMGSVGVLGKAATGKAISDLTGAALLRASLAAIGPGGAAGGALCLSAAGSAVGARMGAMVSNAYFGAVKNFAITRLRSGTGPGLIFINGFLSEKKEEDFEDWLEGTRKRFPNNPCYGVSWESKNLKELGMVAGKAGLKKSLSLAKRLAMRGTAKGGKALPLLGNALLVKDIVANPWHTTLYRTHMVGTLLADLIRRTEHPEGFILMGHSLGARVILHTLEALSNHQGQYIRDVYMFGGAVSSDPQHWENALKAVSGKIYNYHSENDRVLKYLYRSVQAFRARPAGLVRLALPEDKVVNIDVSSSGGHTTYKKHFRKLLDTPYER